MRFERVENGLRIVFDSLKEQAEFKIDQINHIMNVKRTECIPYGEGEKERYQKELEYWKKIVNSVTQ